MSTLNALRLTMRGCDMIALANLFLVFPVMQVRLRVGWGVVVCQRRSPSRQFCCCVEGKSACVFLSGDLSWRPRAIFSSSWRKEQFKGSVAAGGTILDILAAPLCHS